jgi:enolase-phosphatase E1
MDAALHRQRHRSGLPARVLRSGVRAATARVSRTPAGTRPRAILLDIEGTTTPIAFVTGVLFPYARRHLRSHVAEHADAAAYDALFTRLRGEHATAVRSGEMVPPWTDEPRTARLSAVVAYVEWLMDRDRKSTALKELQGRIWEEGYRRGELAGDVFPDVRPALERWYEEAVPVGIFSSGSVLAQQLLFRHSCAGDLTGLLRWYFDTRVGAKADPDSYRRIAASVQVSAEDCVFLSDVTNELDAARAAGMQGRLVIRPGNAAVTRNHGYDEIRSFEEIVTARRQ